ncbi:MAG TPA: ComEC/Rec2 family competence protein [Caulobacteraceae bacterium]
MCIEPVGEGANRVTTGRVGLAVGADIIEPIEAGGAPAAGVRRPALIMPLVRLPSLTGLARGVRQEVAAQWERALLWTPVAFGTGAAAYLGAREEPSAALAWGIAGIAVAAAILLRRLNRQRLVLAVSGLLAVACVGFWAAKLHSDAVAAPIAPKMVATIEGYVIDIESPSAKGPRLLIAPVAIAGLDPAATPTRIRLVAPQDGGPEATPPPGSAIRVLALLDPPPGPASPGAYDFARDAWFEGVGGVGLALKAVEPIALALPPWQVRLEMGVNALRWNVAKALAANVRTAMGPAAAGAPGLTAAVTTSHQDWLPGADRDALRGSGLAHMLAIAGLHTAAVTGFAFFAFRFAIAAWPWLAVRLDGKKTAAAAALVVTAAYLLLSGAHPPARRAAVTASVAFIAILADRRAVSMHSLALAAMIILALEPEAVLQPGFEMSFCATASLVAMAELWPHAAAARGLPWPLAALQRARDVIVALAMVSLVAGAATGPFAIQHFNRVANYGVFANLSADFVASAILMPCLALCLLAQSLGLDASQVGPLFGAAGMAAKAILAIGHTFSEAPGAAIAMASAPPIALALSYVGIVFACLWKGRLRWLGLPLAFAVALWPRPTPPAAWIANDGSEAALAVAGQAVALKTQSHQYAVQAWAQHRGLALPADPDAALDALYACDRSQCDPLGYRRPALAAWWTKREPKPDRLEALCAHADILILRADAAAPGACHDVTVLRRDTFDRLGAAEIYRAGRGWRFVWSQPLRGIRPWTISGSGG